MPVFRLLKRTSAAAVLTMLTIGVGAQERASVQKLLEQGALEQAVQRAEGEPDNPESTYFAAQAFTKMNNSGRAADEYRRLQQSGDAAWKAIGDSGAQLANGDVDAAMQAANQAIGANGDHPYAHYQLGIVASRRNDFARAAPAFERAAELKPDFAYAHYYAGLAFQRLKETAKMSEHLERFLRLAPEAPERPAVAALLRTLRPR